MLCLHITLGGVCDSFHPMLIYGLVNIRTPLPTLIVIFQTSAYF